MKRFFLFFFLVLAASCSQTASNGGRQDSVRKAVYVIIDGVPADMVERLDLTNIKEIASRGAYGRSYVGGTVGRYDQTPTISAVGYTDILTGTWLNKHNVPGNDNLEPNYNYWTLFRIAKEQGRPVSTGLFSSWIDNRTVLLGEGKPETGNLEIDYVYDGYENDYETFPKKEFDMRIFDIDEHVSQMAAECIRSEAPDLSWVYLWYTDDAGHIFGNGETFDEFTRLADAQIGRIWEAVKYREENFGEEWMMIATTDHGRDYAGYGHGGQSERERTTWLAVNQPVNERLLSGKSAATDINPSLCRWMGFDVPKDIEWEQDGVSFYGETDIMEMEIEPWDNSVKLIWQCLNKNAQVTVWATPTNNFKTGGVDQWTKLGTVPASAENYTVDMTLLPESNFYKFVLETPNGTLNRWYDIIQKKYTNFKYHEPVNPNATPEARELLKSLYKSVDEGKIISGLHHNKIGSDVYYDDLERIAQASGVEPKIWGGDIIHGGETMVELAKKNYASGHIITIMWHAGRPFDSGPVSFRDHTCGKFTDEQWEELVTEGSPMHKMWLAQVDSVSTNFLMPLKEAGIPVLWRPYHEMNGEWFWWGWREGPNGFTKLYKMMWDRMVNYHHLDNLLWVWNANAPRQIPGDTARDYELYYPGNEYVDVLATDVYHRDWKQSHHDQLIALGGGKLIALGEIGSLPTPKDLETMNKYAWFMIWTDFTRDEHNTIEELAAIFDRENTVSIAPTGN